MCKIPPIAPMLLEINPGLLTSLMDQRCLQISVSQIVVNSDTNLKLWPGHQNPMHELQSEDHILKK